MHPALATRLTKGLGAEIIRLLASYPHGVSQAILGDRLPSMPGQSTLSRAMSKLIAEGIVVKTGTTRNALFGLSPAAAWFAQPIRPPVAFDPARISAYRPNVDRWLPETARRRMTHAVAGVAHRLDASTYSRQIAERFLIDLSWASSSLEGNTYDRLDSEALIRFGQVAEGKNVVETTMILNHKSAIGLLLENVGKPVLDLTFVGRLHALLMHGLIEPRHLGAVRNDEVQISGSSYRPSRDRVQLTASLGELFSLAARIDDPFEASFVLLAGATYIQAFFDGNKRMGRLLCNVPMLWRGIPPLSFVAIDKASYLSGLVIFYELGDLGVLADVVADSYAATAGSYAAAIAVQRVPRSVELKERDRIAAAVRWAVENRLAGGHGDPLDGVIHVFGELDPDERTILVDAVSGAVEGLNFSNAFLWGVSEEQVRGLEERGRSDGR